MRRWSDYLDIALDRALGASQHPHPALRPDETDKLPGLGRALVGERRRWRGRKQSTGTRGFWLEKP